MQTTDYYTIRTTDGNFLLPDDNEYLVEAEIRKLLTQLPDGKLTEPARKYLMISELERETDDYDEEEIAENVQTSLPLEYNNLGGGLYVVSDRFLKAIEVIGITAFAAHKCLLVHESTNRQWDYWFLMYSRSLSRALVTGRELYFLDADGVSTPYYSHTIMVALSTLLMRAVEFDKHTLKVLEA